MLDGDWSSDVCSSDLERHFRRMLELKHPDADTVRLYLGQIAEDGKRWDEAIQWYAAVGAGENWLAAQLRHAGVLAKRGSLEEAQRFLEGVRAANAEQAPRLLLGEAQLLRDAGRVADAFALLDGALARQPDQPELLYESALVAERLGRTEIFETRLRHLLRIKPDHAHAYNALGYSLADRNLRLDEAKELIDKALALAPDDPFILDSKGWLLFRRGELAGALAALQRAFSLRADAEIAAHLGEVLWALGRKDEAQKTWRDAAQASPGNEVLAATIKRFQP
jgi:tetratricopeptide (TPR) repeat protein